MLGSSGLNLLVSAGLPKNAAERVVTILTMIHQDLLFALAVGLVGAGLTTLTRARRRIALALLAHADFALAGKTLLALVDTQQPAEVQSGAVRALGGMGDPAIAATRGVAPQEAFDAMIQERVPLRRPQTAQDIGQAVVFLCKADNITGESINVTGGSEMA